MSDVHEPVLEVREQPPGSLLCPSFYRQSGLSHPLDATARGTDLLNGASIHGFCAIPRGRDWFPIIPYSIVDHSVVDSTRNTDAK